MILHGNQRSGARDLARHLLKEENEYVEVNELRGFVSNNLVSALDEAHAMSKSTKAKQYLFSLSLNPPKEAHVSTQDFKTTIDEVENTLKLSGQPRAIVFHIRNGRKHCHVVWSRTDTKRKIAIPLPHTKRKLMEISRSLYIKHGWKMPKGMISSENRDMRNFTHAQWQQTRRTGKDPRKIKQVFQESWSTSDNKALFAQALKSRGYILAKGDKRGFVALDHKCEIYAVSKWTGVKTKEVRAKLGDFEDLPSVSDVKSEISNNQISQLEKLDMQQSAAIDKRSAELELKLKEMVARHAREHEELEDLQNKRQREEHKIRQQRFKKGLSGIWERVTGKHSQIRKRNEEEMRESENRDEDERDALTFNQLDAFYRLENRSIRLSNLKQDQSHTFREDIEQYQKVKTNEKAAFKAVKSQSSTSRSRSK